MENIDRLEEIDEHFIKIYNDVFLPYMENVHQNQILDKNPSLDAFLKFMHSNNKFYLNILNEHRTNLEENTHQ